MPACETCASSDGESFGAYIVCSPCQVRHWGKANAWEDRAAYVAREEMRAELELEAWFVRNLEINRSAAHERTSPELHDWLADGGWHIEYARKDGVGVAGPLWPAADDHDPTWGVVDHLIASYARNESEQAFLEALAAGHDQGEARRLSGLAHPEHLLRRIRSGYAQQAA